MRGRVTAAAAAADEHERAEASRFRGVSAGLDDANRGGDNAPFCRVSFTIILYIAWEGSIALICTVI